MEILISLVAMAIVIGVGVGYIVIAGRRDKRTRQKIQDWAQANGLAVVDAQRRMMDRGPFFWDTSQFQGVYYVTVRNPAGQTRAVWIRSGRYWGGDSATIDVKWAE